MSPIEIIVIVVSVVFVGWVLGTYIYKKIKKQPVGDCACCHQKGKNIVKAYRKKYKNK